MTFSSKSSLLRHTVLEDVADKAFLQAFVGHLLEGFCLRHRFGTRRAGKNRIALLHHESAAASDNQRIINGFGDVLEHLPHLVGRLKVVVRRQTATVGLRHESLFRHTDEGVVRFVHAGIWKKALVGRYQRQVMLIGKVNQRRFDAVFVRQLVALKLDIGAA
jgi:hypothetical protein